MFIYVREQVRRTHYDSFLFVSRQNNGVYLKPGDDKSANHVSVKRKFGYVYIGLIKVIFSVKNIEFIFKLCLTDTESVVFIFWVAIVT